MEITLGAIVAVAALFVTVILSMLGCAVAWGMAAAELRNIRGAINTLFPRVEKCERHLARLETAHGERTGDKTLCRASD